MSAGFSGAELDDHARALERDGVCVLRQVFDRALIERWSGAFSALVEERRGRAGGLAPRGEGRFYVTLPWTQPFADPDVFASGAVLGVLDRVFAQEYRLVQLGTDTPVRGSQYQEIHRDYRPLFSDDVVTPLYALAVNFALCDVTKENGPFEMARGTHRMPKQAALDAVASGAIAMEPFPMRAGDVMIRTPLALHRGTPNRTDRPRPMIVLGYVMHWLHTPKVELQVPRRDHARLPPALQALLRCELVDELATDRAESYVEFAY